jgi:hypothetical protein
LGLGEAGGKEICVHGDALASSPARLKHQTGKEGDIISPAELSGSSRRPAVPGPGTAAQWREPNQTAGCGGPARPPAAPAFTIEEIFGLTKIDRWFLVQIKEIVDFEEELATAKN